MRLTRAYFTANHNTFYFNQRFWLLGIRISVSPKPNAPTNIVYFPFSYGIITYVNAYMSI